jgi:hypothetical protein
MMAASGDDLLVATEAYGTAATQLLTNEYAQRTLLPRQEAVILTDSFDFTSIL